MPNFAAYILCAVKMSWYSEFSFFLFRTNDKKATGSQRTLYAESMLIRRWYYVDMSKTKFRRISTYLFDVISLIEKSTSFLRTFFDVISMVEKSKLFPHTFFNVISMVEKTTLFPHTFFDVILMVEKSTLFPRTFLMSFRWSKNPPCFHALVLM